MAVGGGLGSRRQPAMASDGDVRRGRGMRAAALGPLAADGLPGLDSTWGDATRKVGSSSVLEAGSHWLQRQHEEQSEQHKRWWRVRTAPVGTGSISSRRARDRRAPLQQPIGAWNMAVERLTGGPHAAADFQDKNNTRKPDSA
jgi:hypothetical protein